MSGSAPSSVPWAVSSARPSELDCGEAAELLGVPPATLAHWSECHQFPLDVGREGAPRFRLGEIEALSETLPSAHSVLGAIRAARVHFSR